MISKSAEVLIVSCKFLFYEVGNELTSDSVKTVNGIHIKPGTHLCTIVLVGFL